MNPSSAMWLERVLRLLIRYGGAVQMLALVAVFIPYNWMNSIHQALGMGTLPPQPIVGYLARSLSLFYALTGGLLMLCSFDLHRYRPALCYLGATYIFFGLVLWGVDFAEGMPVYWKRAEGPFVLLFGTAIFLLALRLKSVTDGRVPKT